MMAEVYSGARLRRSVLYWRSSTTTRMTRVPTERTPPTPRVFPRWMIAVPIAVAAVAWFTIYRDSGGPAEPAAEVKVAGSAAADFQPTIEHAAPAPAAVPDGMVWIPGGEFSMGAAQPSDAQDVVGLQATRDSRPVHRVSVDGFWMDRTEVTIDQFAAFVAATG